MSALAGVALLAALLARPAAALEVSLAEPRENGGHVWVDVLISDPFAPRVEESLSRGMPATLQLHVELWRHRTGWFDRLESSFDASVKIRYDVWTRTYRIERKAAPTLAVSTLDSVSTLLSRPFGLPAGRVGLLEPRARYYIVVSVTLKPLSVEDVEEGEGWLSGEVATKRRSGVGILTALPRSLFDAVRNFAGLGDQHDRAITEDFDLESLFASR